MVGLGLIVVGVGLLWWNEGRAVKRAQGLTEGAAAVRSVEAERIDPQMDGHLIHLSGKAIPGEFVADPLTDFVFDGLALEREVEMYQWRERKETTTKKNLGGSEDRLTTYTYERVWEGREISSESFKENAAHRNPAMPFRSEEFYSEGATLGAYGIGPRVLGALPKEKIFDLEEMALESIVGRQVHVESGTIYLGSDPGQPEVGDVRIGYFGSEPQAVSVVGKQNGDSLEEYLAESGSSIFLVEPGIVSAENMFERAEKANTVLAWVLRGVGLLALFFGFSTVLRPIAVFADVVPLFGSIASAGIAVVGVLLACVVGFVTIALAWVFFRPLIGILLLVVVTAAAALLFVKIKTSPAKPPIRQ